MGSRKKRSFLSGRATKRGGGLNVCVTEREKKTFVNVRKKVPMATKPGPGGGAIGLSGRATKKITFFVASLIECTKGLHSGRGVHRGGAGGACPPPKTILGEATPPPSQFNQLHIISYIQLVINSIYEFELLILATFLDFGQRIFWFKILKILLKTVCLKRN